VSELEKARAARERAEAWKVRAIAFSYVMLALLYGTGSWFLYKIGMMVYEGLKQL